MVTTDEARQLADALPFQFARVLREQADEIDRLRTAVTWCIGAWITPGVGVSCQDLKAILEGAQ